MLETGSLEKLGRKPDDRMEAVAQQAVEAEKDDKMEAAAQQAVNAEEPEDKMEAEETVEVILAKAEQAIQEELVIRAQAEKLAASKGPRRPAMPPPWKLTKKEKGSQTDEPDEQEPDRIRQTKAKKSNWRYTWKPEFSQNSFQRQLDLKPMLISARPGYPQYGGPVQAALETDGYVELEEEPVRAVFPR